MMELKLRQIAFVDTLILNKARHQPERLFPS